jgi:hypothetical protein
MKNESILPKSLRQFKAASGQSLLTTASRHVLTLRMVAMTIFISMPVWAQEPSAIRAGLGEARLSTDQGLEGVWNVVVTIRDAAGNPIRSFQAMNMYIDGGEFEEFGVGTPASQRGPGMGVWQREGEDRYSAMLEFFRFNTDGTFAGTQKVTRAIELNAGKDTFTSSAKIQILDINGQLIQSSVGTETATRFK